MGVSLQDAINQLTDRKLAVYPDLPEGAMGAHVGEDQVRLLLVGMDVDYEELKAISRVIMSYYLSVLLTGESSLPLVIVGMWADGYMTGRVHEQMIQKESNNESGEH